MIRVMLPDEKQSILMEAARHNAGKEICGFILKGWRFLPMRNVSEVEGEFAMDDEELLAVYRAFDGQIEGVYHSHPNGRREPSNVDIEYAPQGMRYWIVTSTAVIEWDMEHDPPVCIGS